MTGEILEIQLSTMNSRVAFIVFAHESGLNAAMKGRNLVCVCVCVCVCVRLCVCVCVYVNVYVWGGPGHAASVP